MFEHVVTSVGDLRDLLGEPGPTTSAKSLPSVDPHPRAFLARSPFALLATSGADGTCDVSPRGDAAGFARVLDDHTVVLPERPATAGWTAWSTCWATRRSACCSWCPACGRRWS